MENKLGYAIITTEEYKELITKVNELDVRNIALTLAEGRVLDLEEKLKRAVIIKDNAKKGRVSLGSKVDFVDEDGDEYTYSIVGTTEADAEQGRISNESPIGNALLEKKAGDVIKVNVPAGIMTITIKKVY